MDRKKGGRKTSPSGCLLEISSQVTMGQTQGRQLGKQDSAHLEHSETPGLYSQPSLVQKLTQTENLCAEQEEPVRLLEQ